MKTPTQITVMPSELKAINKLASIDETRYVLCGVSVELRKGSTNAILVATDGRRLGALRVKALEAPAEKDMQFIIPSSLIRKIPAVKKGESVNVSHDGSVTISQWQNKWAVSQPSLDGNYPAWKKVVPVTPFTVLDQLNINLHLLIGFYDVARALGNDSVVHLRQHQTIKGLPAESMAMTVHFPGIDFIGVIMPVRVEANMPDWEELKD